MKTILINNRIQLINDSTYLTVSVICPQKNIQKMLNVTNARFISKKETQVQYNHNAGQLFEVEIKVQFSKIEKHLRTNSYYNAENQQAYVEMIAVNGRVYNLDCLENKVTGIYEFGNCASFSQLHYASYYTSKSGRTIELNNNERTDFGKKRYINNAGTWYSNKKY